MGWTDQNVFNTKSTEVVNLAKDPSVASPFTRPTTSRSQLEEALVRGSNEPDKSLKFDSNDRIGTDLLPAESTGRWPSAIEFVTVF
ncbi:MAG: hypothetical protein JNM43_23330 [Planctomycetaceae bacterium]|nr:hypothetical protein [Planctomycetaceae bacterium]